MRGRYRAASAGETPADRAKYRQTPATSTIRDRRAKQTDPTLSPFFNPAGIAVIGASTTPAKLGFGVARNLVQSGYTGAISLRQPRGGRFAGAPRLRRRRRPAGARRPGPHHRPAPQVAQTLAAVGRRGIHAAIISGGFARPARPERRWRRNARVAREHNIRLHWPLTVSAWSTPTCRWTRLVLPPPGAAGRRGVHLLTWCHLRRRHRLGARRASACHTSSAWATRSTCETDTLAPGRRPHTKVITLYLKASGTAAASCAPPAG